MEKYIKPILAIFIFFVMQLIIGTIVSAAAAFIITDAREAFVAGDTQKALEIVGSGPIMGTSTIVSGLLTCPFVYFLGVIGPKTWYSTKNINWKLCSLALVSSILIVFASNVLSEFMALPNWLEDSMIKTAQNPIGIIAIAFVAPFVEEFVMREGITGYLMRRGVSASAAILFSAFVFGIIHLNPQQVPFACIIGIVLAIIYVKTGSIVISYIVHMLNNLVSVILLYTYGEEASDISIINATGIYVAIGLMIITAVLGILGLKYFWDNHPTPKYENDDISIAVY